MTLKSLLFIFSSEGFPARRNCGIGWSDEPWWGWIHIIGDVAIWLAYMALSVLKLIFAGRKFDEAEIRLTGTGGESGIAQVSHEIRTPLAAMLGCVDSLALSRE